MYADEYFLAVNDAIILTVMGLILLIGKVFDKLAMSGFWSVVAGPMTVRSLCRHSTGHFSPTDFKVSLPGGPPAPFISTN